MIIPIRVECENFLVFREKQVFNFKTTGMHYIYGVDYDAEVDDKEFVAEQYSVGVGKSTLAMVMEYALYGEIQKNYRKKDRIINKKSKKNLYVRFDFSISSTDEIYRIDRYRKHDKHKDKVFVFKYNPEAPEGEEWKDMSGLDKAPTQDIINSLIVLDKKTFEKSVLFTREDKYQFLELSVTERGGIFENVVQINRLKQYLEKAKKKLKSTDDEIVLVNNEITKISTMISSDRQFIVDIKDGAEKKKSKLQKEIEDIREKVNHIVNINKPINKIIEDIKTYKAFEVEYNKLSKDVLFQADLKKNSTMEILNARNEIERIKKLTPSLERYYTEEGVAFTQVFEDLETYKTLSPELEKLNYRTELLEDAKNQLDKNIQREKQTIERSEKNISALKLKIQKHEPIRCKNCQAVQNLEEFEKERNALEKELAELLKSHQEYVLNLANLNIELSDKTTKISQNQILIDVVKEKITKLNVGNDIIQHEKELRTLSEIRVQPLNDKYDQAEQRFDELLLEQKKIHEQMDALGLSAELINSEEEVSHLLDMHNQIKLKTHEISQIDVSQEVSQREDIIMATEGTLHDWQLKKDLLLKFKSMYDFWINRLDFKNEDSVKQFVVMRVIPVFNNCVQQMVDAVFKGDLVITFDKFFNETIIFNGQDYEYDELSTGQKMKLNFCINLAIFDLTRVNLDGCNIIFFDEIFTNVDLPTILTFLDIIRERYAKNNGVYLISHQTEVKENFIPDTITRIEKRDWESAVVCEKI